MLHPTLFWPNLPINQSNIKRCSGSGGIVANSFLCLLLLKRSIYACNATMCAHAQQWTNINHVWTTSTREQVYVDMYVYNVHHAMPIMNKFSMIKKGLRCDLYMYMHFNLLMFSNLNWNGWQFDWFMCSDIYGRLKTCQCIFCFICENVIQWIFSFIK